MFNVTVAGNTAGSDGAGAGDGGGIYAPPGPLQRAQQPDCQQPRSEQRPPCHPDCSGDFFGVGYNLIENVDGCNFIGTQVGDVTGLDPALGPLQDNGGPTLTRALQAGSPAIDAGNPSGCVGPNGVPLIADQRGALRNGALRHRRVRVRFAGHADSVQDADLDGDPHVAAHPNAHAVADDDAHLDGQPTPTRTGTRTRTPTPTHTRTATLTTTMTLSPTHTLTVDPSRRSPRRRPTRRPPRPRRRRRFP